MQDINAAGGLDVAGKKLPIEMTVYDDQSDLDTSMRLLTKLMEEDKVDFVFAPCSTAFLFAAAGVTNATNYLLMSSEGGATTLETEMTEGQPAPVLPVPELLEPCADARVRRTSCKELGIKTASICYIDDLHGIEYQAQAQIFLAARASTS